MSESLISNEEPVTDTEQGQETTVDTSNEQQAQQDSETDTDNQSDELIFGKYKDMDAATSAFKELESTIGKLKREKRPEAPEEYELSFKDDAELGDMGDYDIMADPNIEAMMPIFKEANLSQEQVQALVKGQLMFNKMQAIDEESAIKEQKDLIGPKYNEMEQELSTFARRNLDESERETLMSMAVTADSFNLIHKLIGNKPSDVPAKSQDAKEEDFNMVEEEAIKLRRDPDFFTSKPLQDRYNKLMSKLVQ